MNLLDRMKTRVEQLKNQRTEKAKNEKEKYTHIKVYNNYDVCVTVFADLVKAGAMPKAKAEELLKLYRDTQENIDYREFITEAVAEYKNIYICPAAYSQFNHALCAQHFVHKAAVNEGIFYYIPNCSAAFAEYKTMLQNVASRDRAAYEKYAKENKAKLDTWKAQKEHFEDVEAELNRLLYMVSNSESASRVYGATLDKLMQKAKEE